MSGSDFEYISPLYLLGQKVPIRGSEEMAEFITDQAR